MSIASAIGWLWPPAIVAGGLVYGATYSVTVFAP